MAGLRRASVVLIAGVLEIAAISACGQATDQQAGAGGPAGYGVTEAGPTSASVPANAAGRATGLIMAMPSSLGQVVTDDYMLTLYRFDQDSASPPRSTCDGACARRWPPVLTDGHTTASGIDKSLVGTVTRPDGTRQLTLAGWPLYRYAGDQAAGSTNGQGVDGAWHAVAPNGTKAVAGDR